MDTDSNTAPVNGTPADATTGAPYAATTVTAEPIVDDTTAGASGAGATGKPAFRLVRSRSDRMLGGVCGGVAAQLGIDPALVRIGLVALTILGAGAGAVLYVAAWALAPEED